MNKKEYKRQHYLKNKDKYKENNHRWLEKNREYYREYKKKWYRDNTKRLKDYRDGLKEKVYAHYGHMCKCCKEENPKFLTIDHVNNDGYKDRRDGFSSDKLYSKIIKEDYPKRYQILCYNCNMGKARNDGVCPHLQN